MTVDLGKIQLHVRVQEPDLGLMEIVLHPGADSGLHRHTLERETFLVLEGSVAFTLEGREFEAGAGEAVSIPVNALHRFGNAGPGVARAVLILNPGGLVNYFLELRALIDRQAPASALAELNARYGLEFGR